MYKIVKGWGNDEHTSWNAACHHQRRMLVRCLCGQHPDRNQAENILYASVCTGAEHCMGRNLRAYYEVLGRGKVSLQGVANTVWFFLDILLVVTYFKYSKNDCTTELEKKCQISFGILALVICVGLQVLFIVEFGNHKAEIYSAYLQNIAMSIAYLYLLNRRRSSKGQTRLIAICK